MTTCSNLFKGLDCTIIGNGSDEVVGIAYRSDAVKPGDMFFCIVGLKVDGHSFAQDAIDRGAKFIVAERRLYLADATDVTVIIVDDSRKAMAHVAANFYGNPSHELALVVVQMDGDSERLGGVLLLLSPAEVQRADAACTRDALSIRDASRDDEKAVLVGNAARDGGNRIIDALDDELHARRLRKAHGLHPDLVLRNGIRDDKDGVGTERMAPRERHLAMQQSMVHSQQFDHRSSL